MNIGLDLDGVVYPWHESIYRHFIEQGKFVGTRREFWPFLMSLPWEVQNYYVSIPLFYLDTTPTDDVLEYVPKIAEIATIFYITARPPEVRLATEKFFNIYQLPFSENLIFTQDKLNHIRVNRIQYFLDDRDKHVDEVKSVTNAYLFKAVHNWQYREKYNVINTMQEFYELIKDKMNTG